MKRPAPSDIKDASASPAARPLPKGWRWVRLGEVCRFVRGVSFDKADVRTSPLSGYIPILRAGNIGEELDLVNDLVWVPPDNVSEEQRLKVGDIAVCMSSGSPAVVGKTAQLRCPWDGSVGAFCGIVRPNDKNLANYLALWFRSPGFRAWRDGQARGANIQNLRFSQFENIEVPLPPLPEQKRIAAMLKEQLASVARARAAAEARLLAATDLPAACLRQVFGDSRLAEWPEARLGEVLRLRKEVVHPHDNPRGPALFVGLQHVESCTGVRTGQVEVEMSLLTGRKPRFYQGDIVYGYLRPYLNKVWLAEFDGLCSVDQYAYSVDADRAYAPFIAWFMRSPAYLERSPVGKTPGWLPRIRTEEVASVRLNLPPLAEQVRIAKLVEKDMAQAKRVQDGLLLQLEAINVLPAALLQRAFNGNV